MKECAFEPDARAMKILDYQETEITTERYEIKVKIDRRVRLKIFSKEGAKFADIRIPYLTEKTNTRIVDIVAYIFNLDSTGTRIEKQKLEKNQIFSTKTDDRISSLAFTFPDVKAGSIIEFRYTYIEKNPRRVEPWFFQSEIPTQLSVCKFVYSDDLVFDYRLTNTRAAKRESNYKYPYIIETFAEENIAGFRSETMMSSAKDNLKRLDFSYVIPQGMLQTMMGTDKWDLYTHFLVADPFFGKQIHLNIAGTEVMIDSAKILPIEERIHFICEKVKSNLVWDKTYSCYADDLNKVWKNRLANSAEINLSVLNLLLKSGIKAYPVLISTRDNGRLDKSFNSLGQFNGVDILIGDTVQFYVIDGTQKHIFYKIPPINILNRDVLLINNDSLKGKWLTINDHRPLIKSEITINAALGKDASLRGNATISYFDYSKANILEKHKEKLEQKYLVTKENLDIVVDSLVEENTDNKLLPLVHKFMFTYKLSSTNDYYFLDPFFLSQLRTNPFINDNRNTDIDLGGNQSFKILHHITVPENYLIEDLPENVMIRSKDSSMMFSMEFTRNNNILQFHNFFEVSRPTYGKEEYPAIKDFFKKMFDALSERVVLKIKK